MTAGERPHVMVRWCPPGASWTDGKRLPTACRQALPLPHTDARL